MTEETLDTSDVPGGRLGAIAGLVLLAFMLLWIPKGIKEEIDLFHFFALQPPVVKVPSSIIILIAATPTVLFVMWAIIKRIMGTLTASQLNKYIKIVIYTFPFVIVAPPSYKWQYSRWVSEQGYERCHRLTGTTFHAPKVWVRDIDYCIDNGFDVRIRLIKWAMDQTKVGSEFSPEDFYQKASQLRYERGFDD